MAIDLDSIVNRTRRLINDTDSTNFTRSTAEMYDYVSDANDEIPLDYFDFTTFVVTGGNISPTPDGIDAQLIATKTALNITLEDVREAAGDSILIQTGDIKLDTSKAPPHLVAVLEFLNSSYNGMILSLNMDGKSSSSAATGIRVDNYVTDTHSSVVGNSLL